MLKIDYQYSLILPLISIERCSRDQGVSLSSPNWGLGLDRDSGGLNWLDNMPMVTSTFSHDGWNVFWFVLGLTIDLDT